MSELCMDTDFVDIIGLCDPDEINFDLVKYPFWTQISIPENLIIPDQKPDIEQIDSLKISVEILKRKVIVTPVSLSGNEEGKRLTGRKLIIEGQLCQTVTYTADVPEQSVHSAHFIVPFSAFIVVDAIHNVDPRDINFEVKSCVEDVFIKQFCKRQIFKNVTLFLQAVPAVMLSCSEEC